MNASLQSARSHGGRPPRITTSDIGRAVVEIGFQDATFALVAERLQVTEMTVYRHVDNRRGLMSAGLEVLFSEHDWQAITGDWRTVLGGFAGQTWKLWDGHPGAAAEAASGAFPTGFVKIWADAIEALILGGFDPAAATIAADMVFDFAASDRRGRDQVSLLDEESQADLMAAVERGWQEALEQREQASSNRIRQARQESEAAFDLEPQEWFEHRLEVLLDGIEKRLAPGPADPDKGNEPNDVEA